MSFAACTLQAYCAQGSLSPLKSDPITIPIDVTLMATISVISGLILAGIIPLDLPPGIVGYIHMGAWAGVGIAGAMFLFDCVAGIKRLCHRAAQNHLPHQIDPVKIVKENTPLIPDIQNQDHETIFRLQRSAEIENGFLHSAIVNNQKNKIAELLDQGANINEKNQFGDTPLHTAVNLGLEDVVAQLLSNSKILCDAVDDKERTPLYCAVKKGNLKMVNLLIDAGADVNRQDKYKWSPLHEAVSQYFALRSKEMYTSVIERLLQCPTIQNNPNGEGTTPFQLAQDYCLPANLLRLFNLSFGLSSS
jgi:Ankyrin repeats (3 copies)